MGRRPAVASPRPFSSLARDRRAHARLDMAPSDVGAASLGVKNNVLIANRLGPMVSDHVAGVLGIRRSAMILPWLVPPVEDADVDAVMDLDDLMCLCDPLPHDRLRAVATACVELVLMDDADSRSPTGSRRRWERVDPPSAPAPPPPPRPPSAPATAQARGPPPALATAQAPMPPPALATAQARGPPPALATAQARGPPRPPRPPGPPRPPPALASAQAPGPPPEPSLRRPWRPRPRHPSRFGYKA